MNQSKGSVSCVDEVVCRGSDASKDPQIQRPQSLIRKLTLPRMEQRSQKQQNLEITKRHCKPIISVSIRHTLSSVIYAIVIEFVHTSYHCQICQGSLCIVYWHVVEAVKVMRKFSIVACPGCNDGLAGCLNETAGYPSGSNSNSIDRVQNSKNDGQYYKHEQQSIQYNKSLETPTSAYNPFKCAYKCWQVGKKRLIEYQAFQIGKEIGKIIWMTGVILQVELAEIDEQLQLQQLDGQMIDFMNCDCCALGFFLE